MAEQVAAPVTPNTIANNIVQSIHDKANGKTPPAETKPNGEALADPNAGKEKYVVDGKDVWLTPEQRTTWIQKGMAFEPKVTQLSKLQNETGAFLQTLAKDPLKILTDKRIGLTPEAVMEKIFSSGEISDTLKERVGQWYYENVVAPLKMSPEERKMKEMEKENQQYKTEKQQIEEQKIREENKRRFDIAMPQLKTNIAEAMKESGLPNIDTPLGAQMSSMVAQVMNDARIQRKQITPKQAIELVKARLKSVQTAYYDSLDEESLVKEIGEANAKKVQSYFLKLVKAADKSVPAQVRQPSTPRGERKTISPDDMRDYLDGLKKENKPTRFK